MKLSCNVIKDILPLYAEDMVSDDTKALVQEHLQSCGCCAGALKDMKREVGIRPDRDTGALKTVKRGIAKRRRCAVVLVFLLTVSLFLGAYLGSTERVYLRSSAVEAVEEMEGGLLLVRFADKVDGYAIDYAPWGDGEACVAVIRAWESPVSQEQPKAVLLDEGVIQVSLYWMDEKGSGEVMLWGDRFYSGAVNFSRVEMKEWFTPLAVLAGVLIWFTVAGFVCSPEAEWLKYLVYATLLFACGAVTLLLFMGGSMDAVESGSRLALMMLLAAAVWGCAVSAGELVLLSRGKK